jgi:ABC-type multidrug transport system fused ATPase/permease subunit
MMPDEFIELEEEEHTSQLTFPTLKRIIYLLRPHWRWMMGFLILISLTAGSDALFTYLNKYMLDEGIMKKSIPTLLRYASYYGCLQLVQAGMVFGFIYLAGILLFSTICRTCLFHTTVKTRWDG